MQRKTLHTIRRRLAGMTLLEMLASIAIIGIATTGMLALLGINASYIFRISNKADNTIAAQFFLQRVGRELRSSCKVDSALSNNTRLWFYVPQFDSTAKAGNGNYGFAKVDPSNSSYTNVDTYVYVVQSVASGDSDTGVGMPSSQWQITRFVQRGGPPLTDPTMATPAQPILNGVVGPTSPSGGAAKIFQYLRRGDTTETLSDTPADTVGAVVLNLNLMRANQAKAAGSTDQLGFRTEVYLRNVTGMLPIQR